MTLSGIDILATKVLQPCVVTTRTNSAVYFDNNLLSAPSYLGITDATILTSITDEISNSIYNGLVVIPKYITTISTLTITDNAKDNIFAIQIPNSVTSIDDNAFAGLSKLEDLEFENGIRLSNIGKEIFSGCALLDEIQLP